MHVKYVRYCVFWCHLFFFFKQKTAYEVRISDWSSDVCSSDLVEADRQARPRRSGDDVVRAVADLDIGKFDVRRLEPRGPLVERDRVDRGQDLDQLGNRIVGEVRIGDVPLCPRHVDPYRSEEHTSELQ